MRPAIEILETDAGYVVQHGQRRSRAYREFTDAVAAAHRMAPGIVIIWGPGDVPDSDVVAVGYRAEDILAMHGRRSA